MSAQSIARQCGLHADTIDDVHRLIREAAAIQEMAWRTQDDNVEDFEMLRLACSVTSRLLDEANDKLTKSL